MASLSQRAQDLTEHEIDAVRDQIGPFNDAGYAITGFVYPFNNPNFYIKFGNPTIAAEAKTQ